MKFINFFQFFWVLFTHLDPDPIRIRIRIQIDNTAILSSFDGVAAKDAMLNKGNRILPT